MDERHDQDPYGLEALERGMDALIATCRRLKEENDMLRAQVTLLMEERALLVERNENARVRVESIIARLKEMEEEA